MIIKVNILEDDWKYYSMEKMKNVSHKKKYIIYETVAAHSLVRQQLPRCGKRWLLLIKLRFLPHNPFFYRKEKSEIINDEINNINNRSAVSDSDDNMTKWDFVPLTWSPTGGWESGETQRG